ncbi:MAG: D-arabinono-1,4-lactone oxidase [Acidimicrobiia bacterium]
MSSVWTNWGGNQRCRPAAVEEPGSVLEVIEAVGRARAAGQPTRVVGAGHSFTGLACTAGRQMRLDRLDRVLAIDREAMTVTVEAGIPLWRLNRALAERGLALANLGDIDRQALAGALATGTHGTGRRYGNLATFVRGFELVTADGNVVRGSAEEETELLHCGRVSLGALGVVTTVTLQVVESFRVHAVERPRRFDDVLADLEESVTANEHFEFYWFPHTDSCSVKEQNRTDEGARRKSRYRTWRDEILMANAVFGAVCAAGRAMPSAVPRLAQYVGDGLGRVEIVDESYEVFCSSRLVRFVEMEYAVPWPRVQDAVRGVRALIEDRGLRVSFPIEVRIVAADDIPLSPAHGRETAYVAVHMFRGVNFEEYFRAVEELMNGLDGRPHWGKMHWQTAATLAPRYPEWDRFQALRRRLDPEGWFTNPHLDRVLGPPT